jgi:hypothetical protein
LVNAVKNVAGQRLPRYNGRDLSENASFLLLRFALAKDLVSLDTVIDTVFDKDVKGKKIQKKVLLRNLAEAGVLLYEMEGNGIRISFPVVLLFLFTSKFAQLANFHAFCQFPHPVAGTPFEDIVLQTIVIRLNILKQRNLPVIFPLSQTRSPLRPCDCCGSDILDKTFDLDTNQGSIYYEEMKTSEICLGLANGVYKMAPGAKGIDGLLYLNSVAGHPKPVLFLIQCSSLLPNH